MVCGHHISLRLLSLLRVMNVRCLTENGGKKQITKTLHVLQPSDAQAALDSSIALFCAATCSQCQQVCPAAAFLTPEQKPPYAFSGHHQGGSPAAFIAASATPLVSGSLGLRQTTHSRCSDKPAPHHYPPSATST